MFLPNTGRRRTEGCPSCERAVEAMQIRFAFTLHRVWQRLPHRAPCGLPCIGGGVGREGFAGIHGGPAHGGCACEARA